MKSYFIRTSTECAHPGEFWKKFKPLLPSKCAPQQNIQLLEDGRLITDNIEVANVFNKYFTDDVSAHIPNMCKSNFVNYASVNEIRRRHKCKHFSFSSVEVGYIKDLLVSLKPNKATGSDNISPRVLVVSSEALAVPLTNLINHCISANAWPSLWKCSNVTPLFKKDSPADKTNYRPVSVLTSLSKIFERVQHDQMLVFSKSVLSDRLSGFLKGHSCTTALLKMTEDFRATLDNKDSVSHSLLLSKFFFFLIFIHTLHTIYNKYSQYNSTTLNDLKEEKNTNKKKKKHNNKLFYFTTLFFCSIILDVIHNSE